MSVETNYFDELLKLGVSKKYVKSDECVFKYERLREALSLYNDRILSLCKRYNYTGKDFLDNTLDNSQKELLIYILDNYEELSSIKYDDIRDHVTTWQISMYELAPKKDDLKYKNDLKYKLERVGLFVIFAIMFTPGDILKDGFKKEELQAFYNCDNYNFEDLEHRDYDDEYMLVEFPDL